MYNAVMYNAVMYNAVMYNAVRSKKKKDLFHQHSSR